MDLWRTIPLLVVAALTVAPVSSAQGLDLSSGELYGLRIDAEYKLGPQDADGHDAGAWGASAPAPYANSGREWVFAALGPVSGPVQLDADGLVKVSAWMGGGDGELGQHDVAWELKAGETVIATGEAKELMFVMELVELTWEVAPTATTIDPSMGDLTFRVYTTGFGHGLRINLGETPGWTRLTLPVVASSGSASSTSSTSETTSTTSSSTTSTGPSTSSTPTLRDEPSSSTSSSRASTSTGNGTGDDSKDSPAPPLAFAGLAVLLAAVAVRRRLR